MPTSRAVLWSFGLALAAGCGRGFVPAEAPAAPRRMSQPVRTAPAPAPFDPCAGLDEISTFETPLILRADCEPGARSCTVPLPLRVRNCTDQQIVLQQIELRTVEGEEISVIYEPENGALLPGEAWVFDALAFVGSFDMVARYDQAGPRQTDAHPLDVVHPRRDEAMAECEACNGDWGPHGMMGTTGCLCRTADGGTPCDDGLDCEAKCISAGGGFECAEFTTTFGCRSYLPDGWSTQTPTGTAARRVPRSCVD